MNTKSKIKKYLKKENAKWPLQLKQVPESDWPKDQRADNIKEVWRSRNFLVQIFDEGDKERLSIITTSFNGHRWVDGIKWDDLQRLKKECGRGHFAAVEIYPPDEDVVDVANMRHLWVLPEIPEFCWRKKTAAPEE